MSEESKAPRKPGKVDYIKAVFLSAIIVGVVTFSNDKLTFKQSSEPPPIYSSEALIGNWNEEKSSMEFKTTGLCEVTKIKKPLLRSYSYLRNSEQVFQFGCIKT